MQTGFLAPVDSSGRSAPEVIFRRLSEAIATGQLKEGDRLPSEADLAALFGVAIMTLRRGLEPLRDVGLIDTRRGRFGGNFVSANAGEHLARLAQSLTFTRREVRELTDWRRAISGEATFLAAERRHAAELKEIVLTSEAYDKAIPVIKEMRLADAGLHLSIAGAAQSSRLLTEERQIQAELSKLLLSLPYSDPLRTKFTGSHSGIIRAIIDQNSHLAREELTKHVEDTFSLIAPLLPDH